MAPGMAPPAMESTPLYLADTERRSFRGTVIDVDGADVLLDRTAFYPGGGGQPHDTGVLETEDTSCPVTDVSGRGEIWHTVTGDGPAIESEVRGRIDWDRRRAHMRYHTAQHLLSAVLLEDYDAQTTGNQVYADRARIDCAYERFHGEDLTAIETRVNELIEADHPVCWYELDRSTAEAELDPTRTRLDLLPPAVDPIRIVEIDGVDRTACAGTHVAGTGRIGRFVVEGRETAGRGAERIRFTLADESTS